MLLTAIQLQNISHFREEPVKGPNLSSLFISALEILFIPLKSKPEIEGMTIFDYYNYLYYAYADDTKSFLEGYYFYKEYSWYIFSHYFGLKPNLEKSEIGGIEVLKGVQLTVCGMRCIDLNIDTLEILGTYFSYNEKSKENTFL